MRTSKVIQELFLDICTEFIEKRLGQNPGIIRQPGLGSIQIEMVSPEGGGRICWFDDMDFKWVETSQEFTSWAILGDGNVYVRNPQDVSGDDDLFIPVNHPREVAELLYLFVQPPAAFISDMSESHFVKLGKIADPYALIQTGKKWRALDLSRLPEDTPADFHVALGLNLTQNWKRLVQDGKFESWRFAERWPDFIGTLPDAAPLLRGGYVYMKDQCFGHGLHFLAGKADLTDPFLPTLFSPSRDDISMLYLHEFLNYDKDANHQLQSAFSEENDLGMIHSMLKKVSVTLPVNFNDQILLIIQNKLLRDRVLQQAENLVFNRTFYRNFAPRYLAAAQALSRMVEATIRFS
ncbi:MAG: hypothetical protein WCJ02_17005 [bacterium]